MVIHWVFFSTKPEGNGTPAGPNVEMIFPMNRTTG